MGARGLGLSARPDPPYGPAVWADDLAALLDVLALERVQVWAVGFGAYIAHRFAAVYPDRVGALLTYSDVWAGDPLKGYAAIWDVYSAIVRNFGIPGAHPASRPGPGAGRGRRGRQRVPGPSSSVTRVSTAGSSAGRFSA